MENEAISQEKLGEIDWQEKLGGKDSTTKQEQKAMKATRFQQEQTRKTPEQRPSMLCHYVEKSEFHSPDY